MKTSILAVIAILAGCAASAGKPSAETNLWLENRISRNAHAPINRPPLNQDELLGDKDYYDDAYLASMAEDKVNGLWIHVHLDELAESSARLDRLGDIVRRAAHHGIGIWLMMNEPACLAPDAALVRAHPDWFGPGPTWWDRRLWCPCSEGARAHVREKTAKIFRTVPQLAGIINISSGEGLTTCLSLLAPADVPWPDGLRCPRCKDVPPWKLHADMSKVFVAGMREGNPSARLFSWFYHPEASADRRAWVAECAQHLPDGVTLVYNFESGSVVDQLGRAHVGGDYWLSVPGPAKPFADLAAMTRTQGGSLAAKIQVGCSHELATLPYVPVPGLLYRKFKGLREAGVRDVVQGWFFGTDLGLMNTAAGRLAAVDFSTISEADFLSGLAADHWGAEAARVVRIWQTFAAAYEKYPHDNALQYYGPFAAGIVWPLEREVRLSPLARTWVSGEPSSGDFIGECLGDFSLDEVCTLTREMADGVRAADADLAALEKAFASDAARRRDLGIWRAFRHLIVSAADVFAFYRARRDGDTDEMDRIAIREIDLSRKMLALAEADDRLGWHPEAGVRLFSPEALRRRIAQLQAGLRQLSVCAVSDDAAVFGRETVGSNIVWCVEAKGGDCVVRGSVKDVPGLVVVATDRFGTVRPKVRFMAVSNGAFTVTLKGFVPGKIAFLADENPSVGSAAVLWPRGRRPVDGRLALPWVDGASFGDLVSSNVPTAVEPPYAFRQRLERVHERGRRDFMRTPGTNEYVVADGLSVGVPAGTSEFLRRVAADFVDYLAESMSVEARLTKDPAANVRFIVDADLPARQYRLATTDGGVEIAGADERAVAQAFYRLEDRMNLRRAPFLEKGSEVRTPVFEERLTHPGYGYAMYPDEHLRAMAHAGMTAVIVYINGVDGNGWNNHRADVGAIIRRAARHGLDTYLYSEIPLFAHPDDGDGPFAESYGRIAARYPEAKGIIIVGESCAFPSKDPRVQPRKGEWGPAKGDDRPLAGWFPCRDYPDWLRAVQRAIRAHAPDMKTVFWTYNWGWAPEKDRLALIDDLPEDTVLQATFDMFEVLPRRNGITTPIADYSLSFVGPSAYFASEAAAAKRRGLRLFTQANAGGRTWDFGTAPYEPFPMQWRKRWEALVKAHADWGLSGVMENHHYGWSPTFVSELEKEAFTEGGMPFDAHLHALAARDFGEENAASAVKAWHRWSAVIEDYIPTDINQYGPFRCGPAYPFTAGRPPADRKTFPVEPLSEAGSSFIRMEYLQSGFVIGNTDEDSSVPYMKKEIELLGSMAAELEAGAQAFAGMKGLPARRMERLGRYLAACCRTARNVKRGAVAESEKDDDGILAAARDEYANARDALKLVEADSHLGWEPMMDYVGGPRQIRWKLDLMEKLYGGFD